MNNGYGIQRVQEHGATTVINAYEKYLIEF